MRTPAGRTLRLLFYAATLLAGAVSHADGKGFQFGVNYGLSVPDAQNTKQYYMFGFRGWAAVSPVLTFGGYYLQSDNKGELNVSQKFRYSLTGLEAAYHLPASNGDTFIALRIGVTKLENTQGGMDLVFSPYHYGLAVGYDYYLGANFAFGFEGSYLHAQPGRAIDTSGTFETDSFNIISFLLSLSFRL